MRHLAALLSLALLASACGHTPVTDQQVTAMNLGTGEVKTFGSPGEVPAGWGICTDATCSVPPPVPCQQLGEKVCTMNPECRLKEVWCEGEACACPACQPGMSCLPCNCPPPQPPKCEYTCIPKLPLLCEELTDEKSCTARTDCSWGQLACPQVACLEGQPCPPCPSTCVAKAPETCGQLDETDCKTRKDCVWGTMPCTAPGCVNPACWPTPIQACGANDCGAAPAIAKLCPDGSAAGMVCAKGANGSCGWQFMDCPPTPTPTPLPAPICSATDCGPALGMPNYLCPDGKTIAGPTGKCLADSAGKCAWEVITCPK